MKRSVDPALVARVLSELRRSHRGAGKAVHWRELARKLRVARVRTLQECVQWAREKGWRICGTSRSGIYLPETRAEQLAFIDEMLRRERAIRKVRRAFERGRSRNTTIPATRARRAA